VSDASPPLPRTSSAAEDYLERISELIRTKGYARVVDIAAELGISQASVTTMVQKLDADGLLKYEKYRGMALTRAGEAVAARIAHRHELLTTFLRRLGLPEAVIAHDVEGLEHHISPETYQAIAALDRYLESHADVAEAVRRDRV
jgi:Mn-dependent DtxR family transcriptional regulator